MSTLTVTCSAIDAAGVVATTSVVVTATSLADGSGTAPSGAPQFPTLFSQQHGPSITHRPSWAVAGVDYAVGPHPGIIFKQPTAANLPIGCNTNQFGTIQVFGNNVTLSGFDFSNSNEIRVLSSATGTCTVIDCLFDAKGGGISVIADSGGSVNLVVRYCAFINQNTNQYACVRSLTVNTTVEYCLISECDQGIFVYPTCTLRYNLIKGVMWTPGGHPNGIYIAGTNVASSSSTIQFNTLWSDQTQNDQGFPMGLGIAVSFFTDGGNFYASDVGWNTVICSFPGAASYMMGYYTAAGQKAVNGSMHDNHMYAFGGWGIGASGVFYPGGLGPIQAVYTNNIDMATGGVLVGP